MEPFDAAYEVRDRIYEEVHALLNTLTESLSEEQDKFVRKVLADEFRFWRRLKDK